MKKSYKWYVTGGLSLGASFGVLTLLARWITANTILSTPETLFKYGIIGGLGYSLMGIFAFILFSFVAVKIKQRFSKHETIGDVLHDRLPGQSYVIMMGLLLLTSFDSLFIQAMGAGLLFHLILDIPAFIGLFIFFLYCFIYAGIGGMDSLHKIEPIKISLIFAAIIFIPVYFFIQEGIYPVYDGVRLYHPYLLYWKNYDGFLFILTAILIGFGQVITDRATWQRIHIIQPTKVRASFWLTGLIWGTIPLALFSMLLISIFDKSFDNTFTLLFEFIYKIDPLILVILFFLFCFSTLSTTVGAELHATTVLIVKNIININKNYSERKKYKLSYLIAGLISLILFIISSVFTPNLLELIFFFGQFYGALIVPMLWVIFGKKRLSVFFAYSILVGIGVGTIVMLSGESLLAIWISFITSGILSTFIYMIGPSEK
ncbi:sodium:solute symporter family transporter [Virgibacillus necropolis]|uniref:Sodium:solute symporter n=1 Tax=Virgibacillus necropolis TaxID=163877 RepID=A0A221MF54_9BACI|nr:hypothetical protein [Virgibacillus necropolis]ASN06219.1 hypothetical protein CFK40_14905 [Virgibacillus necropolis]